MPCPFVHLSLEERRQLARLREQKIAIDEIARRLGRHRSTIYRELKRNWWHDAEVPQAKGYWPVTAQQLADGRRRSSCKLARHPDLRAAVIDRLKDGWSPEQIAGRLKVEPGSGPQHWLCHETIYRFVYSAEGQSQELAQYLPERRRARKPRSLVFPGTSRIHHRPKEVNVRAEFGHWEADLMIFRKSTARPTWPRWSSARTASPCCSATTTVAPSVSVWSSCSDGRRCRGIVSACG
ncbi:IS30 family transposase [Rubellimicrobium aerolatum]|uniref:IS30 family transposase n=1 Tax=Rubellimicrobium aerolatum TaxID=490979 RepID=A0ABW0SH48_9RHOB|nr:IS30 family transposase [Rubellimicrobium aerolatum]MBP1807634.1 IS30 family transposase [Rubellimicrobium aerolatum]